MKRVVCLTVGLLVALVRPIGAQTPPPGSAEAFIEPVRTFADAVLEHGRDVYGPRHTPLFVDGLNVTTREPAKWKLNGQEWILSNLASQQNLLRTLDGLTRLTGDPKYHAAAVEVVRYAFEHLRSPNGLLYWGGHCAYDAATEQLVGELHGGKLEHELKRHYPYFELLWEVDPKAATKYVEAFWGAHILSWSNLEMNRHGSFTQTIEDPWGHTYEGGPVFFPGGGLSFVSTGSDLYYAAALLSHMSRQDAPLTWAKRMAYRYVETRNEKTGLSGYQYTRYIKGDRAQKQFGPEFGERVLEGTLLVPDLAERQFADASVCEMMLGEVLGECGKDFQQWGLDDLCAYARHAYNPRDNTFCAMITDGTKLTSADVKRKGYYGPARSDRFDARKAGPPFFRAYAMAWRLSRRPECWETARSIGRGLGLGDIGTTPQEPPTLDAETTCSDAVALLGLLELYAATDRPAFLELARRVGANVLKEHLRGGFFVAGPDSACAKFDRPEPLALLHLSAAIAGKPRLVPTFWPGKSFFHCDYDGMGRTYDNDALYGRAR